MRNSLLDRFRGAGGTPGSSGAGTFRADFTASLVVFLVAVPLCVGVAVASGVPAELGLITGIVGGLVTGFLPGSSLQVSGPAAGLTVLVYEAVEQYGVAALGVLVLVSGLLQLAMGAFGLGRWFRAISVAVVQGMLAGIGLVLIAGQLYALADAPGRGLAVAWSRARFAFRPPPCAPAPPRPSRRPSPPRRVARGRPPGLPRPTPPPPPPARAARWAAGAAPASRRVSAGRGRPTPLPPPGPPPPPRTWLAPPRLAPHVHVEVSGREDGDDGDQPLHVRVRGHATFLRLPKLLDELEGLPREREVELDLTGLRHVDHACEMALATWTERHNAVVKRDTAVEERVPA
ncbi:hypothetical protein SANTM175S_02785 [Streptomyces antimycoticus]